MGIITRLKVEALCSALNSLNDKEIVDVIEAFGKREFKDNSEKYFELIRQKLASVIVEIGKRMR